MSSNKTLKKEGIFDSVKKFTDDFFDGLKSQAINHALQKAKQQKEMPKPLIDKMVDLQKQAREFHDLMKKYDPDYED
jgi:hypothetical protein